MIFQKIIRRLILSILYLFSPFFFIIIKLLKPLKIIRITPLYSNRYGHLVINPELYLLEKRENFRENKKYFDLFYSVRLGICNQEMLNLWKKKIRIFPYYILEPIDNFLKLKKKNNIHKVSYFNQKVRDLNGYLGKYPPSISLNQEQINVCEKKLADYDIDVKKEKFVCLFNRDDAYLNSTKKKKNWYYLSHHNYRIKSFELAARRLSSRDIKVFRMGVEVEEKFDLNDRNIIDYANSKLRSELMDIYLASNCFFGISCGTGSSHVAILNRRPIVDLNANLHHLLTFLDNSILLSKGYFSNIKKRYLSLREILFYKEEQIRGRDQLDQNDIEMIDCSPEEIADAIDEMNFRLDGNWNDSEEILNLQKKFKDQNWKNIYQLKEEKPLFYHGEIRGRYSSTFLLKNQSWLN